MKYYFIFAIIKKMFKIKQIDPIVEGVQFRARHGITINIKKDWEDIQKILNINNYDCNCDCELIDYFMNLHLHLKLSTKYAVDDRTITAILKYVYQNIYTDIAYNSSTNNFDKVKAKVTYYDNFLIKVFEENKIYNIEKGIQDSKVAITNENLEKLILVYICFGSNNVDLGTHAILLRQSIQAFIEENIRTL